MKYFMPAFLCFIFCVNVFAQKPTDTTITVGSKVITLGEVVVNNKLNVPKFRKNKKRYKFL
jgi:hypothetical protein